MKSAFSLLTMKKLYIQPLVSVVQSEACEASLMAGSQPRYLDLPTGNSVPGVSGDAKSGDFDSEGFDDFTYDISE